jgi:hypothetical protein
MDRTDSPSRDSNSPFGRLRTLARFSKIDFNHLRRHFRHSSLQVALQDRHTVLWLRLFFFVRGTIHIGPVHLLVTTRQEGWRTKLTSNRAVRLRGYAMHSRPPTAPRHGPPSPAGRSRRSERRMGLVPWHFCDNQRRVEASPLFGPEAKSRATRFRYDLSQANALLIKRLFN